MHSCKDCWQACTVLLHTEQLGIAMRTIEDVQLLNMKLAINDKQVPCQTQQDGQPGG